MRPSTRRSKSLLKAASIVLASSLALAATFAYGVVSVRRQNRPFKAVAYLVQQKERLFPTVKVKGRGIPGAWGKHVHRRDQPSAADREDAVGKLEALPYLQGYKPAPAMDNVTIYDEKSAYAGLNFVVSAHAPNASVVDMRGNVLHEWRKDFDKVWPKGLPAAHRNSEVYQTFWRRAHLLANGDLLAIFMDYGLIKLDKDSKLLWASEGGYHHDLFTLEDGTIYVLAREMKRRDDLKLESWTSKNAMETKNMILEDAIVVLSPDGTQIGRVSLLDCFLNSAYAPLLEHIKVAPDIFHSNSIKPILADRPPLFKKGQILVSMREIHTIAVVDLEERSVKWAATGLWKYQHEPWLLENGNILLFDNRGNKGKSQAIEFDPLTQKVVWRQVGEPIDSFYSREAGAIRRLPNGNTLITESERGRGFEVTREGKIVWEFLNPHRAGEQQELIAALYDVIRIEPQDAGWLAAEAKRREPTPLPARSSAEARN